jgi:hypothetical protein
VSAVQKCVGDEGGRTAVANRGMRCSHVLASIACQSCQKCTSSLNLSPGSEECDELTFPCFSRPFRSGSSSLLSSSLSAHLTCSDVRPCVRCVKRGEECLEGAKKLAKYLLDPEEAGESSLPSFTLSRPF